MLYDVTNGQAYIDFVTIYDDKANWENADIRIYANNTQWPQANLKGINWPGDGYIFLPPAIYDSSRSYLLVPRFYEANPIDPSRLLFVEAMVHELGHYAFGFYDEYENPKGAEVYPDFNFGFMDDEFNINDPKSTEMSDFVQGDAAFSFYGETEHYFKAAGTAGIILKIP